MANFIKGNETYGSLLHLNLFLFHTQLITISFFGNIKFVGNKIYRAIWNSQQITNYC